MRRPKWFVLGAIGVILVKLRKVECPGGGDNAAITVGISPEAELKDAETKQASREFWAKVDQTQELAQAEQTELENWLSSLQLTDPTKYEKAHEVKLTLGWQGVKEFKDTGKTNDERKQEIETWMNLLKNHDQTEHEKVKKEFDSYGWESVELYKKTKKTWEEREEEQKQLRRWMEPLKNKSSKVYEIVKKVFENCGCEGAKQVKELAMWLAELYSRFINDMDAMEYIIALEEYRSGGWEQVKQWKEEVELIRWIEEADKLSSEPEEKKEHTESGSAEASPEAGKNAKEVQKQELKSWMDGLKTTDQELYNEMEYIFERRGWKGVEKTRVLKTWMDGLKSTDQEMYIKIMWVYEKRGWEGLEKARKLLMLDDQKLKLQSLRRMDSGRKMDQLSLVGLVVSLEDQKTMNERLAADKRAREAEREGAKEVVVETLTKTEKSKLVEWVLQLNKFNTKGFEQALVEYKQQGWEGLKLYRASEKPRKQREEEEQKALRKWMEELKGNNKDVYDKVYEVSELSGCEGVKLVKGLTAWLVELSSTNSQAYNQAKSELDSKGWQAVRAHKSKLEKEEADKIEAEGKQWVEGLQSRNQNVFDKVAALYNENGWGAVWKYKVSVEWLLGLQSSDQEKFNAAIAEFDSAGLDGLKLFKETGKPKQKRDEEPAEKAKEEHKRMESLRADLESWLSGLKVTDFEGYLKANNVYNTSGWDGLSAYHETGKTMQERQAEFEDWMKAARESPDLLHDLVFQVYNSKGWEEAAAYKDAFEKAGVQVQSPVGVVTGDNLELALDSDGKLTVVEKEITVKVKKKEKQSLQEILVVKQPWVLVRWNRIDWDKTQYNRWDDWELRAIKEELIEAELGLRREQRKLEDAEQKVEDVMVNLENLDAEIKALEQAGATVDDALVTADDTELSLKKGSGKRKGTSGERVEEITLADGSTVTVRISDSASTSDQTEEEEEESPVALTPQQQNLLSKKRERIKLDEQVYDKLERWAGRKELLKNAEDRFERAKAAMKEWDSYNQASEQRDVKRKEQIKNKITEVEQIEKQLNEELGKLRQQSGQELKVSQLEAQLQELDVAKKALTGLAEAEQTENKIKQSEEQATTARESLEQRKKELNAQREDKVKELKTVMENANKECDELKSKLAAATKDKDKKTLCEQLKQAEQKLSTLDEEWNKLEDDQIKKKIDQKKKELASSTNELNDLKSKLAAASKDKDKKKLQDQVYQAEERVKSLDEEKKSLESACKIVEEEKKIKEEIENANKELDELKIKFASAKAKDVPSLEEQVKQAEQKVNKAAEDMNKLESDRMNKKIEIKKQHLDNATKELEYLKTKFDQATKNKDKQSLEPQVKLAEESVKSLDEEKKSLEAEKKTKDVLDRAIKDLNEMVAKFEKEPDPAVKQDLEQQVKQLEQKVNKAVEERNEFVSDQIKKKIEQKKEELASATKELNDLKTKLESAKSKDKPAIEEQVKHAEQIVNFLDSEVKLMVAEFELKQVLEKAVRVKDAAKKQQAEQELDKLAQQKKVALEKAKELLGDEVLKLKLAVNELNQLETKVQRAEQVAFDKNQELEANQFISVWMKKTDYELMEVGRARAGERVPKVMAELEAIIPEQDEDGRYTERGAEKEVECDVEQEQKVKVEMVKVKVVSTSCQAESSGQETCGDQNPSAVQTSETAGQTLWLRKDSPEVKQLLQQAKDAGKNVEPVPGHDLGDVLGEGEITPIEKQRLEDWMETLKNEDKKLYDRVHKELMLSQWEGVKRMKKRIDRATAMANRIEAVMKSEAEAETRELERMGKAWMEKEDALSKALSFKRLSELSARTAGQIGGHRPGSASHKWGPGGQRPDVDWGGSGAGGLDVLFGGRDSTSVLRQATFMTSWGGNEEFNLVKYMRMNENLASGGVVIHGEHGWDRLYGWGGMGLGDVAAGKGVKVDTLKAGTKIKVRDHLGRLKEVEVKSDMTVYDGGTRNVWEVSGTLKLGSVHDVEAQKEAEQQSSKQTEQERKKERRKQLEKEWNDAQQQKNAAKGGSAETAKPTLVVTAKPKQQDLVVVSSSVGSSAAAGIRA